MTISAQTIENLKDLMRRATDSGLTSADYEALCKSLCITKITYDMDLGGRPLPRSDHRKACHG